MLSKQEIAGLRELLEKATPGPWTTETPEGSLGSVDTVAGLRIAQTQEVSVTDRLAGSVERKANADLIAEALNALPALLDIAEAVANARVAWRSPRGIIQSEVDVRFDGTDTTGWKRVAVLPLAGEVANG